MINDKILSINPHIQGQRSTASSGKYIPRPYRDVAEGMERQFAEHLINELEKSVGRESMNSTQKYYRSLLSTERAKMMSKTGGGLGLQKMILDQIYPAHLRNKANYELQTNRDKPRFGERAIKMYEKRDDLSSSVRDHSNQNPSQGEQ